MDHVPPSGNQTWQWKKTPFSSMNFPLQCQFMRFPTTIFDCRSVFWVLTFGRFFTYLTFRFWDWRGNLYHPIAYREKTRFPINKSFKSNQRLQFSQGRCRILLGCALQLPHMTRAAQLCWFTTSSNDIFDRNPTVGIDTSTLAQVNCKFPYPNLWRLKWKSYTDE